MSFPNEAKLLIDWSGNSGLSYHEFLQKKEFEKSYRFAVDDHARSLIASNEELSARGISAIVGLSDTIETGLSAVSTSVDSGFMTLSQEVRDLGDSLNSTLAWGFSGLFVELSEIGKTIRELLLVAKNPSATWCYEQFGFARDEIRRRLFPEALRSILYAIKGHGDHLGLQSEFRFHFVHGVIRSGSYENVDPKIVDLQEAEDAFVAAARYSKHDHPRECGIALLGASRAAYHQLKYAEAFRYCMESIDIFPTNSEAHFFLARLYCSRRELREAGEEIFRALRLQPDLVTVAGPPEFLTDEDARNVLIASIERARVAFKTDYEHESRAVHHELQSLKAMEYHGVSALDAIPSDVTSAERDFQAIVCTAASGTLTGFADAATRARTMIPLFRSYDLRFREQFARIKTAQIARLRDDCRQETQRGYANTEAGIRRSFTIAYGIITALAVLFVLGVTRDAYRDDGFMPAVFIFLLCSVVTGGIAAGVGFVTKGVLLGNAAFARSRHKADAASLEANCVAEVAELERQVKGVSRA